MNQKMTYLVRVLAVAEKARVYDHLGRLAMWIAHSLAWVQGSTPKKELPLGKTSYGDGPCDLAFSNFAQQTPLDPLGVTETHAA